VTCDHLASLEKAVIASGAKETFRGQAWSENCREWVYFDLVFDIASVRSRFDFGPEIVTHENLDPRSGLERGFVCTLCNDAVMGPIEGARRFR
jgi:hypothetical protein